VDLSADGLFAGILWVLAGVHIVLLITGTGLLLKGGHVGGLNGVARTRSAFEVTYMAVQFCAGLVLSIYACSRATERKAGCPYYDVSELFVLRT
jgi:hypothetical protein